MPKTDIALIPADYSPVAERIALFYEQYPAGRIVTRLISRTERETIFRAAVYRTPDELEPAATGWAAEREGDGEINVSACLENTETSAIGRALANLGFAAVPLKSRSAAGPRRSLHAPRNSPRAADVQAQADSAADLLALIRSAERSGLSAARADLLRRHALRVEVSPARRERLARVLRRWIARRIARDVGGVAGSARPGTFARRSATVRTARAAVPDGTSAARRRE